MQMQNRSEEEERTKQASEDDGGGSLNVVVESANLSAVLLQKAECIRVAKILT